MPYYLGIDPGWASCGLAITDTEKGTSYFSSIVPRDMPGDNSLQLVNAVNFVIKELERNLGGLYCIADVYIERFVTYAGAQSDGEHLLMFTGALQYIFGNAQIPVHMVRAIDWKPKICKYLVRTEGFNNPYPSFDKKYSLLAAKTLMNKFSSIPPEVFKGLNSHSADAVCLSYLGLVDNSNGKI